MQSWILVGISFNWTVVLVVNSLKVCRIWLRGIQSTSKEDCKNSSYWLKQNCHWSLLKNTESYSNLRFFWWTFNLEFHIFTSTFNQIAPLLSESLHLKLDNQTISTQSEKNTQGASIQTTYRLQSLITIAPTQISISFQLMPFQVFLTPPKSLQTKYFPIFYF